MDEGVLTEDATIQLNECAGILQYCQEIFEGLKAYTTEDGHIVTFRPDLNAERMIDSADVWKCRLSPRKDSWMPSISRNSQRSMGSPLWKRGHSLYPSLYVRKLTGYRG